MPIEITPLTPHIGARLTGIDVRRPLTAAEVEAIDAGMNRHAVLVLPGQDISDEQQLAFTRNFGPLEEGANSTVKNSELRLDPAFADVSNLDKSGEKLARDNKRRMAALGNRLWHSDASFRVVPAKYSILSGRIVTTAGGNTEFADMRAAYDALDAPHWAETEDPGLKLAVFSTGPAIRNTGTNLVSEIIGTFVLVFGVLAIVANAAPGETGLTPLLVGFLVFGIGLSLGGPTGYAINPARDLGPRIAHAVLPIAGKGSSDWEYSWIPVVGPVVGGVLGALAYTALFTNTLLVGG